MIGKKYPVLCWIVRNPQWIPDYGVDSFGELSLLNPEEAEKVYPLFDHLHNDRENGQPEKHYHVDDRFCGPQMVDRIRINPEKDVGFLAWRSLPFLRHATFSSTPIDLIKKSKLKHKCIHKGKCPHRGFDLSGIQPIDGKITCPLHGLEFDTETGVLLNDPMTTYLKEKILGLEMRASKGPQGRHDDGYLNVLKSLEEALKEAKKYGIEIKSI